MDRVWQWYKISALVILADQISKLWISRHFVYLESYPVSSFFNLVRAHNTGASFSMLSDAGGWQRWLFSGIALVASLWMVWLLKRHAQQTRFCLALALILGGALGNLLDRLMYGYVIDFIDLYWNEHHFAAFNVADAAINVGAAVLLWDSFKKPAENKNESTAG